MIKVEYVGVTLSVNAAEHNENTLRSAAFRYILGRSVSQDLINNSIASSKCKWTVIIS